MTQDVAGLIDRDAAQAALSSYTARFCGVLRRASDVDAPAIGTWTVGDVAQHVTWGLENYAAWLRGEEGGDLDSFRNMPAWNDRTVQELPPATQEELADRIESATEEFVGLLGNEPVRWYAGTRLPPEVAIALRLGEAAIHGLDIATAAGEKWDIDPQSARIISYSYGYIAPYFVDETKLDFAGTLRLHARGGADVYYKIDHGTLDVGTNGRAQWHLSVDPPTWILVATGRRNQWAAALTGKLFGWGSRPMLPFKLLNATFSG